MVDGIGEPFVAVEDPGEITLEWNKPLDSGGARITGYIVKSRQSLGNDTWTAPIIAYDGRNSLAQSARVKGLLASTEYGFTVTAFNYRSLCFIDELNPVGDELVMTTRVGGVPSDPKNVRVVAVTGGAVAIAWDAPLSSGGVPLLAYIVYAGYANQNFSVVASVDIADPRTLTLYGLQTSSAYKVAVCAESIRGLGFNSTVLFVTTTAPTPPSPPKNLQSLSSTSGGANILSWDPPDDAGGATLQRYAIYRNGSFHEDADATEGTMVFTDSKEVSANQVYSYTVVAVNSLVSGVPSAPIVVRSRIASIPMPPSVAVLEARGGSVSVEWVPSSDSGGAPIRSFKAVATRNGATVASYEGPATRKAFYNLYAETDYRVSVQTANDQGSSAIGVVVARTGAAEPPAQPPVPRMVAVFGGRVRFETTPPEDFGGSGITAYQFFVNSEPAVAVSASTNVYDIVGLAAESVYSFSVCAVNDVGEGEVSAVIQVTTTGVSAPGIITTVVVQAITFESATIVWDDPLDTGGITSLRYDILLESGASSPVTIYDVQAPFDIEQLNANTYYAVRVRAKNEFGSGEWSAVVTAKTDPISPGTISFLTNVTSVSEGSANVTITATRTSGGALPAACSYRTINGTARAGVQFVGKTGPIYFGVGGKEQTFSIAIINNNVVDDPDKFFYVELVQIDFASGSIGETSRIMVTIEDDGDSGAIQFSQASYSVVESTPSLAISVVRVDAFSGPAVAQIDAFDVVGGAIQNVDYSLATPTVTFADKAAIAYVRVAIVNDTVFQIRKFFGLNITITSGRARIGKFSPVFVEIRDDGDVSPPWEPTNVKAAIVSGGCVNVTWTVPESKGAANVTFLTYRIVVTSDLLPTHEFTTFNNSISIAEIAARSTIGVSVAAKNPYFESYLSAPIVIRMGVPTPPTMPLNAQILWRTGGGANITWSPPFDSGGASILLYRIVMNSSADNREFAHRDSYTAHFAMYGLKSLTDYSVTVRAMNDEGILGAVAPPLKLTTRASSAPSKPPGVNVTKSTGGTLYLDLLPSLDLGGLAITKFMLSVTSPQFPNVFSEIYSGLSSNYVLSRLAYSTEYRLKYKVANAVVRLIVLALSVFVMLTPLWRVM